MLFFYLTVYASIRKMWREIRHSLHEIPLWQDLDYEVPGTRPGATFSPYHTCSINMEGEHRLDLAESCQKVEQ